MKKRIIIIIVVVALVVMALLWFLLGRDQSPTPSADSRPPTPTTPPPTITDEDVQASPLKGPVDAVKKRIADIRDYLGYINKPIEFYGLVIDQDEHPLSGAKVAFSAMHAIEALPGVMGSRSEEIVRESGSDGRFSVSGIMGNNLSVKSVTLSGYELSPKTDRSFSYYGTQDIHKPDAQAPVVFHMWKIVGAEKLVEQDVRTRIPYNGTTVALDLLQGRKVGTGGDIRVTLTRTPQKIRWGQRGYAWTAIVEAVDGGVIHSNDEFMYRAPDEGYQPKVVIDMPANARDWTDAKQIALYLKSRGGKCYGRVELDFRVGSDREDTGLRYHSFLNPNGSRNLEYDPLQNMVPEARPQASAPKP